MSEPVSEPPLAERLQPVEAEFVRFFVHLATTVGLPRSAGEIFGLLFASADPVAFDEVVARLGISKGSASQGLRLLTKIGAVSQVYIQRDRRTFYLAETRMRQLFSNALQESLRPHLEGNSRLVGLLEETIEENAASLGPSADHYRSRASSLRAWNEKALFLLPLLDKIFSLPAPFLPFNLFPSDTAKESDAPNP
jgi:HTH-type transcriptional regulator, glycine betaine synthesis regulator